MFYICSDEIDAKLSSSATNIVRGAPLQHPSPSQKEPLNWDHQPGQQRDRCPSSSVHYEPHHGWTDCQ